MSGDRVTLDGDGSAWSWEFQPIACVNCGSPPEAHRILARTRIVHRIAQQGQSLATVICTRCGLAFLNPQPTDEFYAYFYREVNTPRSVKPRNPARLGREARWYRLFCYNWLIQELPISESMRILDVGAGYGAWLSLFAKTDRLRALEPSPARAARLRESLGVTVKEEMLSANSFADGAFDLVTALALLEHTRDPLAALVEMNRLLAPRGHVYVMVEDLHRPVVTRGLGACFKLVHAFYFSSNTLSSLLRKAGFEIVAVRRRESVYESASFVRPGNVWPGELDILARKERAVTLDEARANPFSGDRAEDVMAMVRRAARRDRRYAIAHRLWQSPAIHRLFERPLYYTYRLLYGRPEWLVGSVKDYQARKLGLG